MGRRGLDKKDFEKIRDSLSRGLFPQWTVTDPDIYELEIEKIYGRTWCFLAHESELKEPGSYVTRWIAEDPILVTRNNAGQIKAFLNSCTHRGVHLCTADSGRKKTFTCPYHGWSFNNDGELIGITMEDRVFGEEMKKDEWGLRPVPRVESYQGMIFGNLDPQAMSLEAYLGGMKWYFDMLLGRSDGGMEVRGAPHRWVAPANWKMTFENFTGDPYHVMTTHRSTVEAGITPDHSSSKEPRQAYMVKLEHGHGIHMATYVDRPPQPYQRMPESMWPMFQRNLTPQQEHLLCRATVMTGGVFPNLSFVSPLHGSEGSLHNYLNFRVWRPLGPDKIELWSWFMIDKAAPEELKEEAYRGYISSFGPAGTLEMDDTENWARIVSASKGNMVRNKDLSYNNFSNYLMGFGRVNPEPPGTFYGPGEVYKGLVDALSKGTHDYWFELVSEDFLGGKEEA